MKLRILLAGLTILLSGATLPAQITGDVMGVHNLGPGSKSPITGARPDSCAYCHAPHSGLNYAASGTRSSPPKSTRSTAATPKRTAADSRRSATDSNQCLSCHDGTVAVGDTVAYGQVTTARIDVLGGRLRQQHAAIASVQPDAALEGQYRSGRLAGSERQDRRPNRSGEADQRQRRVHFVPQSARASQRSGVAEFSGEGQLQWPAVPGLPRSDPANRRPGQSAGRLGHQRACPVHRQDLAPGAGWEVTPRWLPMPASPAMRRTTPAGTARLLRGQNEQDCIACHNGARTSRRWRPTPTCSQSTPRPRSGIHFPTSTNPHDAAENTLLNNNRHATCVDCHNAHGSRKSGVFPPPPLIRISQKDIAGISATDGTTVLTPAVNQFENCLRCHGTSTGKQVLPIYGYFPVRAVSAGDPLNLIPQFAVYGHLQPSRHAYQQQRSPATQPAGQHAEPGRRHPGPRHGHPDSLHRLPQQRRQSRIRRHGPNGPHGSKWTHILERRYEFSQAPTPGQLITNLFPIPISSVNGPYALCGKCHDLANQIMQEHQLEPAQQPHQRRLQLFHLPHRPRHGRHQRNHHRRTADQFRCECRGPERQPSHLLQPRREYLRPGMPPGRRTMPTARSRPLPAYAGELEARNKLCIAFVLVSSRFLRNILLFLRSFETTRSSRPIPQDRGLPRRLQVGSLRRDFRCPARASAATRRRRGPSRPAGQER